MRHQAHVMRAYEVELRDANDLVQWRSAEHAAAEARRLDDARQKHDAEAIDRKARQARVGEELERKQRQAQMDKSASTTRLMRRCQSDLHEQRLKRKRAELSKAVAARARTDRQRRLNASRAEGAMQIRQWHQDAHVNERVGIAEDRATRQRVAETVRTSERIAEDRKRNGPRLGVSLARLAATEFAAHWTGERSRREWIRDTRRQDIRQSIDADRADVQRRAEVVVNARREWHPDKSRCSVQDCTPGCHRQLTTSCSAVSLYAQAKELVDKAERSQCEREAKMAHEQRYVHDVVQRLAELYPIPSTITFRVAL
ncbi:unnamed protein product (mitochondrion) [Plasmodiophora brassicae]|uniref:Uncharacterized protein n=1 Tax=Plasmodiophora brassicae TaxID=37360 RepID=A0A3P3YB56_PLABS|nr:unnamed protein product [Plasmodiophora brassicae]